MEEPVKFTVQNSKMLYGMLHHFEDGRSPRYVVIMVVGGPETRYGSHRLYIQLARFLNAHGIVVLRFDYEGMGDSEGDFVGFRKAGPSIDAAVAFMANRYPGAKKIIWALCDGSSASVIYVNKNPGRISGLVLCNPFILTEEGGARTNLKHYYTKRILEKEFWRKVLFFRIDFKNTVTTLMNTFKEANLFKSRMPNLSKDIGDISLPAVVVEGIIEYGGPVRCVLSTDDFRAREFYDTLMARKGIEKFIDEKKINYEIIKGADHTFTDPEKKKVLFEITLQYLNEISERYS